MANKIMSLFNIGNKKEAEPITQPKIPDISSFLFGYSYNLFDGEKTPGEMGEIRNYHPDYYGLRARSWQSYLDSEITQLVLGKFNMWVIGAGLKVQSEPSEEVLSQEGVKFDYEAFIQTVEPRFRLFAESNKSSYTGMENLHGLGKKGHLNSIVGGDVLVVLRYENKRVTVQLIDGDHIATPYLELEITKAVEQKGNTISNGVEKDKRGKHVAYHVQTKEGYERIEAFNKTANKTVAFMIYGFEYRLDEDRGIPLMSAVLETLKKLDRYKEATVGSAEERQKIAYSIEHNDISTGENPLMRSALAANNAGVGIAPETGYDGDDAAQKVALTTQKTAINMPNGSSLKLLESKNELYFSDFYTTNIGLICAALNIPPEVALSKYDSNFSASRAALKDWEHTIEVRRKEFSRVFYKKIYDFWLLTEVLDRKIEAPGYVKAVMGDDYMVSESYEACRFTGTNIPHIDPLKEVLAERKKLGSLGDHLPLTTLERATEVVSGGEYKSNVSKYKKELTDFPAKKEEEKPKVKEDV